MIYIVVSLLHTILGSPVSAYHLSLDGSSYFERQSELIPRGDNPGPKPETGKDCGIFRMNCASAAGACQNGAFYQNCLSPWRENTYYTYHHDHDRKQNDIYKEDNRKYSGCITTGPYRVCKGLNEHVHLSDIGSRDI